MKEASCGSILQSIIGQEKMKEVCNELGGMKMYVPEKPLPSEERNSTLYSDFYSLLDRGKTKKQSYNILSEMYNITPRRIMQILKIQANKMKR